MLISEGRESQVMGVVLIKGPNQESSWTQSKNINEADIN